MKVLCLKQVDFKWFAIVDMGTKLPEQILGFGNELFHIERVIDNSTRFKTVRLDELKIGDKVIKMFVKED